MYEFCTIRRKRLLINKSFLSTMIQDMLETKYREIIIAISKSLELIQFIFKMFK